MCCDTPSAKLRAAMDMGPSGGPPSAPNANEVALVDVRKEPDTLPLAAMLIVAWGEEREVRGAGGGTNRHGRRPTARCHIAAAPVCTLMQAHAGTHKHTQAHVTCARARTCVTGTTSRALEATAGTPTSYWPRSTSRTRASSIVERLPTHATVPLVMPMYRLAGGARSTALLASIIETTTSNELPSVPTMVWGSGSRNRRVYLAVAVKVMGVPAAGSASCVADDSVFWSSMRRGL